MPCKYFIPELTKTELDFEEWRDMVGYEGSYSVSNLGRVKLLAKHNRILKQSPSYYRTKNGSIRYAYLGVCLAPNRRRREVHVMIAAAFIGLRPKGFDVNHRDGNKWDNRVSNLEYLTKAEHGKHRVESGQSVRGENHWNAILNDEKVRSIRTLYRKSKPGRPAANEPPRMGITQLAKMFPEVSRSTVGLIVHGDIWKHII